MISRWSGFSRRSKRVSLVSYGTLSSPGIGGTSGEEPVAMTIRRGLMIVSPAFTSLGERNSPYSRMTVTPSVSNRSWLSCGSIVAMAWATCSMAAA